MGRQGWIGIGVKQPMKEKIESSLERVSKWVEDHDYKGYDPGDGQLSFLHALTFHNPFLERLLTAAVLRSPFNIRPWIESSRTFPPRAWATWRGATSEGSL